MGFILKLVVVVVIGLVGLKVFLPDRAEQAIEMISENTGFDAQKITEGVELATDIAKDGVELAKDKAIESVE